MKRSTLARIRHSLGRIAATVPVLILFGFILGYPRNVQAQTWNGSVSDLWGTAGNWTPNTVPNSSAASVVITNATDNPVLINIAPTIANLQIGGTNSATLENGESLTIAGGAGAGSLSIAGTLTIGSTGSFTDLILAGTSGSAITLSGGGSLTLSDSPNNRVYSTTGDTLTNDAGNTIQGAGQLGINNAGFGFTLNNAGIINANQSNPLQIAPSNTVTNTGTLEATNGGTLELIGTFANTGGLIQSTGASSVVELSGSTITRGTLTTSGGGAVQNSGTATLDGVTISSGSTFTAVNASSTTLLNTITIKPTGTLAQNSTGSFTDLQVSGTVALAGGGTLAMSNSPNNRIFATGADTLTNDAGNTIQGAGQLGINNAGFGFTLNNAGIINANQSNPLQIAPSNTVTNTGTLEATNGGTLELIGTFANTGGLIQSTGASSVVELSGSTITRGTLTTSGGGAVQNSGTATLDGVTISSGSTFTAVNASSTTLLNTITIKPTGTLAQNSTGSFTDLQVSGTVALAGGGTLAMSNSPNNRIFATGADTLTNDAGNTIQGAGQLGINNAGFGFTLANNGTILANQTAALTIAPSLNTTNNGTFQANSGSTLFMNGALTNYDPATSTLTGGAYNALSGTIELSQASAVGGQAIATNAATILLDGSTAKIADGSGGDILQGFLTTNTAGGRFTIRNGANLTTASIAFTNTGTVNVGANSTFTVGGLNDYVQSGGTTTLGTSSSVLAVASGHSVAINGGTLQGFGTIHGDLSNSGGIVMPGVTGMAGVLTVADNYLDPPSAQLFIQIGGPDPLNGLAQLDVGGTANLNNGTLDLSLINGFKPTNGELFEILTSSGLSGMFNDNTIQVDNVIFTVEYNPPGFANDVVLDARLSGGTIPEPSTWIMMVLGFASLGFAGYRGSRKNQPPPLRPACRIRI
jgi:hypothetical protein